MPSYLQYKRQLSVLDKEEQWITLKNKTHIKLEEGETKKEAIERKFGEKSVVKNEYGELQTFYHGTNANKEEVKKGFKLNSAGSAHGLENGMGFYFTSNIEEAGTFGNNIISAHLDLEHPVNPEASSTIKKEYIDKITESFAEKYIESKEGKEFAYKIAEELKNTPYPRPFREVIDTYLLDLAMYGDKYDDMGIDDYRQEVFYLIEKITGIDGYKMEREDGKMWYVAFNNKRIKQLDD